VHFLILPDIVHLSVRADSISDRRLSIDWCTVNAGDLRELAKKRNHGHVLAGIHNPAAASQSWTGDDARFRFWEVVLPMLYSTQAPELTIAAAGASALFG